MISPHESNIIDCILDSIRRRLRSGLENRSIMRLSGICILFLAATTINANICIIPPVTVSTIQGRIVYVIRDSEQSRVADNVRVELAKNDNGIQKVVSSVLSNEDGRFELPTPVPGTYWLSFRSEAASSAVEVHIKRSSPNRWLSVELGLIDPIHCPPTKVLARAKEYSVFERR
jgi:5-hydroxyisourate hydrolase-like protein (transthyretin family)